MSSNAALSAARRRRSNPSAAVPSSTNMQSHIPPANRIIQRTGPQPQPQHQPQFNQRMPPPPQQQPQIHGRGQPPLQPQGQHQMRVPPVQPQHQMHGRYQTQPLPQQPHLNVQAPSFPPLPPPVKTAGPLYGIPIHPLMMFKTHDNKLNEHDLSIGDCLEQLKEIDERLTVIESSNGGAVGSGVGDAGLELTTAGEVGDINELMNDEVFINGVVDNIMNTTNFASIVENVIPLKQENEALKQQVQGLHDQVQGLHKQHEEWKEKMQQLENYMHSFSSRISSENVVRHVENLENVDSRGANIEGATSCDEEGNDDDHDHSGEE